MKLVLLRHGESVWNLENRFTGWTDVELSATGEQEAGEAGRLLKKGGYDFDICYTSYLKRAIHTLNHVLEQMDREWLPVIKTWKLNERHYGMLQGLNKSETAEKYGEEQVRIWRRSFDVRPPELEPGRPTQSGPAGAVPPGGGRFPSPGGEPEGYHRRTIPYFEEEIRPHMEKGNRVLIAAHGNSLRALVMYFEKLTEEQIMQVNLPTGVPLVYEFGENFTVKEKAFLGDPAKVAEKMQKVANQGKKG